IIHGKGITPDIPVEAKKEAAFAGENTDQDKIENIFDKIESVGKKGLERHGSFDYKSDPQIMSAVNVLKAIQIYGQPKR
ncbi:MAG: hypothetical protein PHO81_04695, partial [Candidatus Omnitrophica bacterium]|nr:hypothetical protein [Candidatus Omnitrophota bacterium]